MMATVPTASPSANVFALFNTSYMPDLLLVLAAMFVMDFVPSCTFFAAALVLTVGLAMFVLDRLASSTCFVASFVTPMFVCFFSGTLLWAALYPVRIEV